MTEHPVTRGARRLDVASALAALTRRLRFGHLVLGNTHRHPALLARIVAEHADGWNANGTLAEFVDRRDALLRHCEAVRRDPAEIEISAQLMCIGRPTAEVVAAADQLIVGGARHLIFVILASEGPEGLRRLAREVVAPLRDRHG